MSAAKPGGSSDTRRPAGEWTPLSLYAPCSPSTFAINKRRTWKGITADTALQRIFGSTSLSLSPSRLFKPFFALFGKETYDDSYVGLSLKICL